MKLSKTSWLLLAVGIFIIAFVGLGAVHYQQVQQENRLDDELALAQLKLKGIKLEQLSYQQEELEKQLGQTISWSGTAKAILSQPIRSVATSETLFDTAAVYGVEVTEISSPGLASDELEGITGSVLALTVRVEGDVSDLISFIIKLNNNLTTGVVKSVEISVPETTSEGKSSANIQLVIYTYQGS